MPVDNLAPFSGGVRLRNPLDARGVREDLALARRGALDVRSLIAGYRRQSNPVEVRTTSLVPDWADVDPRHLATDSRLFAEPIFDGKVWRDRAFGGQRRILREVRRTHNIYLRLGRDRMVIPTMFGDTGLAALTGQVIAYTGTTATTLTGASGLSTATQTSGNSGLQGHVIFVPNSTVANSVFGVIVSNTATAITVDQWYAIPVTGAAGTTPTSAAGTAYLIPGASMWFPWIALSTDATAPAAGDAEPAGATFTGEQTANGLERAYVGYGSTQHGSGSGSNTNPVWTLGGTGASTSTVALACTWGYTTTGAVTLNKVLLYNAKSATGNLITFETLLSASATVSASGDTLQVTWTFTVTSA
jgi:hypothetical protein